MNHYGIEFDINALLLKLRILIFNLGDRKFHKKVRFQTRNW